MEPQGIAELLDRHAIAQVLHAYARNLDANEPARMGEVFTEDCTVDYYGEPTLVFHGLPALQERLTTRMATLTATFHGLSNILVELTGPDEATTRTYVYAWHRTKATTAANSMDFWVWGEYHDRFVRTALGWRVAHRKLVVFGHSGTPLDVRWEPAYRRS